MANMPKEELATVPTGPKRPRADPRDGARTPMQWTAGTNAGFTDGVPWLPVQSGKTTTNVQAEKADPNSIYNWYKALIALRKTPVFSGGTYVPLESGNPSVYAFARTTSDGRGAIVVLNTSPAEQQIHLTGMTGDWLKQTTVLLASPSANPPAGSAFSILPYGIMVSGFGGHP